MYMPFYPKVSGASSGGGSGVDTLANVGSTPNAKAGVISGTTLTLEPADATHPGVVSATSQLFGGAKTFQLDANNFVKIDPSAQSLVKIQSNDNSRNILFEAKSTNAGTNEFPGYIYSTSEGDHVAGMSVSGPSVTPSSTYAASQQRFTSSLSNGMRWYNADQNGPFIWTMASPGGSGSPGDVMKLLASGEMRLFGTAVNGDYLRLDPGNSSNQVQMIKSSGQTGMNLQNQAAGGYSTYLVTNDFGTIGGMQQSGSAGAFGIAANDQTQYFASGAGGALLWSQNGPIKFGTGVGGGASIKMSIDTSGIISMTLPSYVSQAAAATGGLTTGQLYQDSTTNAVTVKT